jgi:biopolymer transport protein ExbB
MRHDRHPRPRAFAFLLVTLLAAAAAGWVTPASAQDEAPAAPAAADPAPAAGDATTGRADDGLFIHLVKSAGPVFGPLLGFLSVALVAVIVLLALDLKMENAIPPQFVEEFTDTVNKRKFKEAFELSRNNPSFLGKVLTGGMSRLQYGIEDARDAAMNMVDSIRSGKEQLNNYTAMIGSLGPLIGLVGTVFGMILAFKELAMSGRADAAKLAGHISHALVVTMLGIGLAVPALFFNTFFRNRITRIATDTANIADDLLTQMYHNSKKPAVVPAPASAASPAPTAATQMK